MSIVKELLLSYIHSAKSMRDQGDKFEELIKDYFINSPDYTSRLENVWLWSEFPYKWGNDDGIDIVIKEKWSNEYWAVQCKFYNYDYSIQKADIDSFFTASGKMFEADGQLVQFSKRLIVSSTDKWSSTALKAIETQTIPTFRLNLEILENSSLNWEVYLKSDRKELLKKPKKVLMDHQKDALVATRENFKTSDRGKLIMACGTGKTLTSLRIMEDLFNSGAKVLFLAPSISLVSQTFKEWINESIEPINSFIVCSDNKIGKDLEDIKVSDLSYPPTTDAQTLYNNLSKVNNELNTVIFSTYQSIQTVIEAQNLGLDSFDLIICDEAHRTTGIAFDKENISNFVKVHENSLIKSKKRLYMTATPRIYNERSRGKADKHSASVYSMDDVGTFGPVFYKIGFGKAVQEGLLAEYKVLIVAVDDDKMGNLANEYNAFMIDEKKAIDSNLATKIIGSWKGLSKNGLIGIEEDGTKFILDDTLPMQKAVAFSKTIKASKTTTNIFEELTNLYNSISDDDKKMVGCKLKHVDGGMNSLERTQLLNWLQEDNINDEKQCKILSNARCLSEGIDVPALDAVIFFDTRDSIVDIVQSVGRVMRKPRDRDKEFGYIILPVAIPTSKIEDYNSYIETDSQFKSVWKVIKALRAHDETLVDEAVFRKKIKVVTTNSKDNIEDNTGSEQLAFKLPELPIGEISNAVYAAVPKKLGDLEYWTDWAKNVAKIADTIIIRVQELLNNSNARLVFEKFLETIRYNLNPYYTEKQVIEMLAQHIITRPIFEALFTDYSFTKNNAVSNSLEEIIKLIDSHNISSEIESLSAFYSSVNERVKLAKGDKARQNIIKNLYDTFFKNAFPKMVDKLGIVYTPIEIVDFLINSVENVLTKEFSLSLNDKDIDIIDPFSGTGTFTARLLQSGLISKENLPYKYENNIHANEILLLAYYISAINIESVYHSLTNEYKPFNGIVLTDTYQLKEHKDLIEENTLPENNEKAEKQKNKSIQVIIGNPPYSGGQESENDKNQNQTYKNLDARIAETYVAESTATNVNSVYDSYIRAIRWATDRLDNKGVIAFVTNSSFLEKNSMDGIRKSLLKDFSKTYVFNLRGAIRGKSTEDAKKEGQNVFNIMTGVAITILVKKDSEDENNGKLYYYDIGDYTSKNEKLNIIENFKSINQIPWKNVTPNNEGDWINQRDPIFDTFIPLGDKDNENPEAIFNFYTSGIKTNRDAWAYNYSKEELSKNMSRMIEHYNKQVTHYQEQTVGITKKELPEIDDLVDFNPQNISWSRGLKKDVKNGRKYEFKSKCIYRCSYRPFVKQWVYFNKEFNDMIYKMPKVFPTNNHNNTVIAVSGVGDRKPFAAFVSGDVVDVNFYTPTQCFPMYIYDLENNSNYQDSIFSNNNFKIDQYGYRKKETITDWALEKFQTYYRDTSIKKENIFWYVYGILNHKEYKERFAANLPKMLPKIPLVGDFWDLSNKGQQLAELHLNYDNVEPYPVKEIYNNLIPNYSVKKMTFNKIKSLTDKSTIIINDHLTISGIPEKAYEYSINGKTPIEWVLDKYDYSTDNKSTIINDANSWSEDPQYIINHLKRIINVSVLSTDLINSFKSLDI